MVLQLSKEKEPIGLLTYRIEGPDCEIVTLDSNTQAKGLERR
jgi:hypothetical protein